MPRVTLKNILSKKNHTETLVLSLINEMNAQLIITDEKNIYLFMFACFWKANCAKRRFGLGCK